jgi:hypothetical protein
MSNMSWKDLRDLDCDAIHSVGTTWDRYVGGMIERTERLRTEVIAGHLSVENYESDTANLVREQIDLFSGRFEDDLSDYAHIRVSITLLEAAEALKAEQDELLDVVGKIEELDFEIEGDKDNYEVNPSGHLHRLIWISMDPPQWLCDKVGMEKSSGWWDLLSQVELVSKLNDLYDAANELAAQYQDWLRAIMSRAHDADDDAAAALSAMRENPPELPPELGATYDDLIEGYKTALSEEVTAEMEAIANGDSDMSPEQVNQWWEDLSDAEREALIAEHPEWVGPTDGIPVDARDTANRTVLDNQITSLDQQIANIETQLATYEEDPMARDMYGTTGSDRLELEQQLAALQEERDQLGTLYENITEDGAPASYAVDPEADPPVTQQYYLLGFGTEEEGRAIISIGNPDTVANVNTYVPGTGGGLDGANGGDFHRLQTMAFDAYEASGATDTANVLWMDYDAPDRVFPYQDGEGFAPEATDPGFAEDAAEGLESFTQGLRATTENTDPFDPPPNLTMTGHSYGTTVIGTAASTEGVDVDNIIFVASPGTNVESANSLGIDTDNVYATRNESDIIGQATDQNLSAAQGAGVGFLSAGPPTAIVGGIAGYLSADPDEMVLGTDPTSDAFGATVIDSAADTTKNAMDNHGTYWDEVNEDGRRDMANVITGQGS